MTCVCMLSDHYLGFGVQLTKKSTWFLQIAAASAFVICPSVLAPVQTFCSANTSLMAA